MTREFRNRRVGTICPSSLDPFYKVSHLKKRAKTYQTYCRLENATHDKYFILIQYHIKSGLQYEKVACYSKFTLLVLIRTVFFAEMISVSYLNLF